MRDVWAEVIYFESTPGGDTSSESGGGGTLWVVDITEVRAVPGEISDAADGGGSKTVFGGSSMRSAGFGNVLNVDPRDV